VGNGGVIVTTAPAGCRHNSIWQSMGQYFLHPPGSGRRHNLHSGLNTVGRNPTNDVRLTEASVSSFHCEIEVDADRVIVRDLESTNGTRLNNAPVMEAELRPGDELILGELRLQLDCESPVLAAPKPEPVLALEPSSAASRYQCTRCQKIWEPGHLKTLRLGRDSAELRFCPACSGRCVAADPRSTADCPNAEPTLLKRLSQTMQIGAGGRKNV